MSLNPVGTLVWPRESSPQRDDRARRGTWRNGDYREHRRRASDRSEGIGHHGGVSAGLRELHAGKMQIITVRVRDRPAVKKPLVTQWKRTPASHREVEESTNDRRLAARGLQDGRRAGQHGEDRR